MQYARWWGLIFILIFTLTGGIPARQAFAAAVESRLEARPAAQQSNSLTLVAPNGCPGNECAAGQRFNLSFDFEPGGYDQTLSPNVKLCVYAPAGWNVQADASGPVQGSLTGTSYEVTSGCAEDTNPPTSHQMVLARQAAMTGNSVRDVVGIALRLGANASGSGFFMARLFVNNGSSFTLSAQALAPIFSVAAPGSQVYVANDAAVCGARSPCYMNSGDDLPNGLGTALRDAVDAVGSGSTIIVLGNYNIKSNTVLIDRPITLTGINDSRITYSGSGSCANAMLSLQDEIILRGLSIDSGACTSSDKRNLLDINSSEPVIIENNDLTGGDNAIFIHDERGSVLVRHNHISGNLGYAIYSEGTGSGGALEMTANNLHANRAGSPVECAVGASSAVANRRVNHNYWGGFIPAPENTHCTLDAAKRLGAPIARREGGPGVNVQLVSVRDSKIYAFNNQIAFRRSGGADYDLYIVDHGYLSSAGAPFTTVSGEVNSPSPCSTYWDVFLPEGSSPSGALELFFKYDRNSSCKTAIDSSLFCGQTASPTSYPLYWIDPAASNPVTDGWNTTGQRPGNLTTGEGQATTCNTAASEIQVTIDNNGRPALDVDLGYTPFMVGLPVLRSFIPLASHRTVNVTWTTNLEADITGFYVLRGESRDNLTQLGEFIPRRGTTLTGVTSPAYNYTDANLENGVVYYYRLQIVRSDGNSFYSRIWALAANVPTITPTFTISPTHTATIPLPTITPRPTLVFTQRPTPAPTQTATLGSVTPTYTLMVLDTLSPDATDGTQAYPAPGGTSTPDAGLASATTSPAATVTGTATGGIFAGQSSWPWISLLLGILAGLAVIGAASGLWYLQR